MPFISRSGNLVHDDDVSNWKYNIETKRSDWIDRDFDYELDLTKVGSFSFEKDTPQYKEMVFSGDPVKDGMYFKDSPWFRILSNRFTDADYWRFYKKYRPQLTGEVQKRQKGFSQTVYYVPRFEDFVVNHYGDTANFHFPIWFLDILIADKVPEYGLHLNRDNQPGVPWTTREEYEQMLEIYEQRKLQEDEALSDEVKAILEAHAALKNKERNYRLQRAQANSRRDKNMAKDIAQEQAKAESQIVAQENSVEEEPENKDLKRIKKSLAKTKSK